MNAEAYKVYERLYGLPAAGPEARDEEEQEVDDDGKILLREIDNGALEVVPIEQDDTTADEESMVRGIDDNRLSFDARLQRDMELSIQTAHHPTSKSLDLDLDDESHVESDVDPNELYTRSHPYTIAGRFSTSPTTLQLPHSALVAPITAMLSHIPNRHLDETAARVFGGPGFPYGTGTPVISRSMPQRPIALAAAQSKMQPIEADIYMAAVVPGAYAAVTSVLVELRKRLGPAWLARLHARKSGPRILDAGAGGASVLAWREVLRASWQGAGLAPFGQATVVTGSSALRERAALLLENTTFLPRLPDVSVGNSFASADADDQGVYDVVAAPYALWAHGDERERHILLQTLWRLTDPAGGVLLLLEKGVPRGFEVIADARARLLAEHMPASLRSGDELATGSARIVAPCTTHAACPLYRRPGVSRGRQDLCSLSQRYTRPPFLQRLLGARERNHAEVRFSFVAVQRGEAGEAATMARAEGWGVQSGAELTARAAAGYDGEGGGADGFTAPNPLTLPRLLMPPLKRHGHVTLDVCTPAGTAERWTVPKSFGRQAYRDARKSQWGDLWALGAKTRVPKNIRLGKGGGDDDELGDGAVVARDVKGRRRVDADGGEGDAPQGMGARKRDAARGRAKARARRREETRALLKGEE